MQEKENKIKSNNDDRLENRLLAIDNAIKGLKDQLNEMVELKDKRLREIENHIISQDKEGISEVIKKICVIENEAKTLNPQFKELMEIVNKRSKEIEDQSKLLYEHGISGVIEKINMIKNDVKSLKDKINKTENATLGQFMCGLGFGFLAATLAISLAFKSLKDDYGVMPLGLLIVMMLIWSLSIMIPALGISGLGKLIGKRTGGIRMYYIVTAVPIGVAYVAVFVRDWSDLTSNLLTGIGLLVFILGLCLTRPWSWTQRLE